MTSGLLLFFFSLGALFAKLEVKEPNIQGENVKLFLLPWRRVFTIRVHLFLMSGFGPFFLVRLHSLISSECGAVGIGKD